MLPVSHFFARHKSPPADLHRRTAGAYSPDGQWIIRGPDVTMCAAGICQRSSVIVTVSDRLASWGHGTYDQPLLKGARLAPLWITLMAAGDLSRGIEDVIRVTRAALKRRRGGQYSVLQMKAAIMSAWGETQNARGTAVVLRPLGMTVRDFKRLAARFTPAKFSELADRLESESRLDAQLLICGFNDNAIPALVACDDDSPWHEFTRCGYAAIGCASQIAMSALARQSYKRENDLRAAIYQLCVAKFESESDPDVGKDTIVCCLREDGRTCWITPNNAEWVRRLWEKAKPSMPDESMLAGVLDNLIAESEWRADV